MPARRSKRRDATVAALAEAADHLAAQRLRDALLLVDGVLAHSPDDADAKALRSAITQANLRDLVRRGVVQWSGGKPKGLNPPIELTPGPSISDWIIDNRR